MIVVTTVCTQGETQMTLASLEDSPRPVGRSGPGSYQITALALVPVPVRVCMCYLRVKTISSSLVSSQN